ncbi:MAG: KOW domain-containing RNA-binding protein [Lachnospiraceae bacterium]|nr:KOW domain-containing RNA-binding protein [Ruminococcus sp.]MCM1275173.1 KOW domain-containing RNA-binding protein [Lachnospiraceae bacterium]
MDITVGRVVISSAGHDSGRYMVVTGADGMFCYVADGKERKLDSPKKKNVKHVRATSGFLELEGMTDKRLRRTLRALSPDCTLQESE